MNTILVLLALHCTDYRAAFVKWDNQGTMQATAKIQKLIPPIKGKSWSVVDHCERFWY